MAQQAQAQVKNLPAQKSEWAITYQAADGQEVKLTPETVKKYLVQGKGELVTMQELVYFLNICRARRLNPLTKDCYLIKYTQDDPAAIITSIDFYRKRARAQKDCTGWKSGIIVKDKDGKTRDSLGLIMDDEELLGGFFEATPEGWKVPFRLEVNLRGYLKKKRDGTITRFWSEDNQPTQIAKVAEAQGLRRLWPDQFQQLYSAGEIPEPEDMASGAIDMEPAEGKTFAELAAGLANTDGLDAFVAATAKANGTTPEEIQGGAAEDWESFSGAFGKWKAAKPGNGKAAKSADPAPAVDPAPEKYRECPARTGDQIMESYCVEKCKTRQGCPAWEGEAESVVPYTARNADRENLGKKVGE